jgi:predicted ArsR family transcriptional regulator
MQLNPRQISARQRSGQHSRDRILASLQRQPDQSREQLIQSTHLTYDQVRDQTRNLCVEGLILSRAGDRGERRYSLPTQCTSFQGSAWLLPF